MFNKSNEKTARRGFARSSKAVMRRSLVMGMLLAVSMASQAAGPSINIGTLHDRLPSDTSRILKRVRNSGDATAYVRVEVSRMVFNEGKVLEEAIDPSALTNADSNASGLIASPSRLIIPANGGQQATTLVHRGAREKEQYYRVRFIPVVPTDKEFSLTSAQQEAYTKEIAGSVSVFTGFGSILIVPPKEAVYSTRVDGNVVRNEGNATIVLENLRVCEKANSPACSRGSKVHVRPGTSHEVDLQGQKAFLELIEGSERRDVVLGG